MCSPFLDKRDSTFRANTNKAANTELIRIFAVQILTGGKKMLQVLPYCVATHIKRLSSASQVLTILLVHAPNMKLDRIL